MKLFPFFKSELIEFYCEPQYFGVIPEPVPAYKLMPDWFKKIAPATNKSRDHFGALGQTAKKCMPLVDGMSMGFIIPLFGDVNIRTNGDCSLIEAGGNALGNPVEFHNIDQLGGKTSPSYPGPAIKFINRWVIKTAPGYSTLFIPPINHMDPRFTCLSALVDTDEYPKEVNFPAVWHINNYDAILPAGTPLITCIPVKRSDVPRTAPIREMSKKEANEIEKIHLKQVSRRSVYTNELRDPRK